ncbi:cytochrome P450 6A1-like isoform X1 [Osmia lignaria lignaria]|uniref:cytochrome P450 6A1-like isoform X1 n=1 Tax=Osmia lignaria lignaria TaxID=1437193 RepID=UPI00402BDD7F
MADYFQLLSAFAVVFLALYYYFTLTFDFWKDRGVNGPQPVPVFGNIKDIIMGKCALGTYTMKLYNEYKNEPMVGIFVRRSPHLVLIDLDRIKDVLIKDFSTFSNRATLIFERTEPLSAHLFNLETERWRPLRTRLSPVFTSGKIKDMFPLILECSNQLKECLEKIVEKDGLLDCREIAARFTTDVIGSCAFGISMNALSDEESEFRRMGKQIFKSNLATMLKGSFKEAMPELYNTLGFVLPHTEMTKFLTTIVSETIKYRKEHNIVRPDFINLLIDLKDNPHKLENIELTDTLLAAQAFVFFAAGFETSSTTIGHALYEMALNHNIQDKLRQEINEFYAKNKGNWTYDDVKGMSYLDKVFKETLRKYPPGLLLRRKSINNYTFSGTKVSIPKDTAVLIPVYAIHKDPNIYPDPEVYDPERFNEDAVAARHPMAFLPFGDGPRNCIGARFAVYQTKIGLIQMLKNFKIDVCDETLIPYVQHPTSRVFAPIRSIILKISKV